MTWLANRYECFAFCMLPGDGPRKIYISFKGADDG
jgi:hypothetical protein